MSDSYSPDSVAQSVRDMVAWDTRYAPQVEVEVEPQEEGFVVNVTLTARATDDRERFEEDLRYILPKGFTLNMNWTD